MTKRLIAAVCFLAVAVIVAVSSYCYVNAEITSLCESLNVISECLEQGIDYTQAVSAAQEEWAECEPLFGAILKHSDADNADRLYGLIYIYAEQGNMDELEEVVAECRICLKVIHDGEKPNCENIF